MFYDPMIAKVCAHGPDRRAAIARLGTREFAIGHFLRRRLFTDERDHTNQNTEQNHRDQ